MKPKCLIAALLIAITVTSWPLHAATETSPQDVAANYFNALKSSDYKAAASLFREADLEQFKSAFVPLFEAEGRTGKRQLLDATFGKDASVETAVKASPDQLFANVVGFVFNANPAAKPALLRSDVLGIVDEPSKQLVHVVTRNYVSVGSVETNKVEVLTMTREPTGWKMVMPDQMRAMGQMIKNSMNAR